jgi:hypothetical protein
MPPIDWYYAKDNKQFGPVNAVELKRLSQTGELRPEDLVWTEGMKEWSPARKVKGLFEEEPAGAKAAVPPAAKAANPFTVVPSSATPPAAAMGAAPLSPFAPAPSTPIQDRPASAEGRAPYKPRHPLDRLLDVARGQFGPSFVESTAKLFTAAGHYGLYAVVVAELFLFGIMGVKRESLGTVLTGLGLALLLLVLQYTAARFIPVIENLSRAGAASLSSGAFLDCTALLAMTAGLSVLVALDFEAIRFKDYAGILTGLTWFVTCEFAGFLALNPGTMAVTILPGTSAGEEALGVCGFLLRLGLRTVPVVFGIGVVSTLILLLYDGYGLLADKLVLAEGFPPAAVVLQAIGQAIGFAALPLAAYFFYLFNHLMVDVLRAVLALPGKLDRLRQSEEED